MGFLSEGFGVVFGALAPAVGLTVQLLWLAGIAWGVGRRFLGNTAPKAHGEAVVLGLVVLGTAGFGLGLVGLLNRPAVLVLAVLALGAGLRPLKEDLWPSPSPGWLRLGWLGAVLALLPAATLLLYPVIGFDPGVYRLATAKFFAASGELPFLTQLRFPVGTQLSELWFAQALLVSGDSFARGVQWVLTLAGAAVLWRWGRREGGAVTGAAAAALWLGGPGTVLYGTDAYVDAGSAALAVAALALAQRAREAPAAAQLRLALAAGLCAGGAAAVRVTGLLWLLAVPLWLGCRNHRAARFALLGGLAVALPWYLRSVLWTGNPVFPLFPEIFGPSDWDLRLLSSTALPGWHGSPGSFVVSLFRGDGPPLANPWLVALVPALGWGLYRAPWTRVPTGLAALFLAALAVFAPDPRFALPAVAVFGLVAAAGLGELFRGLRSRLLLVALALAFLAPSGLYTLYRLARLGPVPSTSAAQAAFLDHHLAGYRLLADLAHHEPEAVVYGLWAEQLHYHAPVGYLGDCLGPFRWDEIKRSLGDPLTLGRVLRGWEVTHLLVVKAPRARKPNAAKLRAAGWTVVFDDPRAVLYALPAEPAGQAAASSVPTAERSSGRQ